MAPDLGLVHDPVGSLRAALADPAIVHPLGRIDGLALGAGREAGEAGGDDALDRWRQPVGEGPIAVRSEDDLGFGAQARSMRTSPRHDRQRDRDLSGIRDGDKNQGRRTCHQPPLAGIEGVPSPLIRPGVLNDLDRPAGDHRREHGAKSVPVDLDQSGQVIKGGEMLGPPVSVTPPVPVRAAKDRPMDIDA